MAANAAANTSTGAPPAAAPQATTRADPSQGMSAEFQQQVVRVLAAHETAVNQMKQQLELDFLVYDEGLKQELQGAMADNTGTGATPKRVTAFRVVVSRLVLDDIRGGRRLEAESNENLAAALLRFKPKKDTPRDGYPWVFTLAPGVGVTQNFREALADLAAHGGNERVKVRRPLPYWGPTVSALAQSVLGKDTKGKGKNKGGKDGKKGKGKGGKDKGGKGKGKDQPAGKGASRATAPPRFALPTDAPPAGAPAATTTVPCASTTAAPVLATKAPTTPVLYGTRVDGDEVVPLVSSENSAGSTQTYASLVAADEAFTVDAEMAFESGKRENTEAGEDQPGLKKSNSPVVERLGKKAAQAGNP